MDRYSDSGIFICLFLEAPTEHMTQDICSFVNMFFSEKIGKILILIKVFADSRGKSLQTLEVITIHTFMSFYQ